MSFSAKYPGWCAAGMDCRYDNNGSIGKGDAVDYVDDELMHAECANAAIRDDIPTCPHCNMIHRGDCL